MAGVPFRWLGELGCWTPEKEPADVAEVCRWSLPPLPAAAQAGTGLCFVSSGHSSTGPTNLAHNASSRIFASCVTPVSIGHTDMTADQIALRSECLTGSLPAVSYLLFDYNQPYRWAPDVQALSARRTRQVEGI